VDGARGYAALVSSAARAEARISKDLEKALLAGFTSVRDVGGYGGEISPGIEDGSIVGPNIFSSISPISMTARHGVSIFWSLFSFIRVSHTFSQHRSSFPVPNLGMYRVEIYSSSSADFLIVRTFTTCPFQLCSMPVLTAFL